MNKFILTCLLTTGVITVTHAADKQTSMTLRECDEDAQIFGAAITIEAKCDIEFIDAFKDYYSQSGKACIQKYGSRRMVSSTSEGIEAIKFEIYTTGLKSTCDRAIEENAGFIK